LNPWLLKLNLFSHLLRSRIVLVGSLLMVAQLLGCGSESNQSVDPGFTENTSLETKSNHIKALFFGTGLYSSRNNVGCPGPKARWTSFPYGSTIEVVIPSSITDADAQFVSEEMAKLNIALAGYFNVSVTQSGQSELLVATDKQLTINLVNPSEMQRYCGSASGGCIGIVFENDFDYHLKSGDSYYPVDRGVFDIHEIGHGIGLCHVNPRVFPEGTMASSGIGTIRSFSESELDAINTVFASGLNVGATEQEFWDAGLIP